MPQSQFGGIPVDSSGAPVSQFGGIPVDADRPAQQQQPSFWSRVGSTISNTFSKTAHNLNIEGMLDKIGEADDLAGQGRWGDAWNSIRELLPGASPTQQVLGNQNGTTFKEQRDFVNDTYQKAKSGDVSGTAANILTAALMNAHHAPAAADAARDAVSNSGAASAVKNAAGATGTALKGAGQGVVAANKGGLQNPAHGLAAVSALVPVVGPKIAGAIELGNQLRGAYSGARDALAERAAAQAADAAEAAREARIAASRANPQASLADQAGIQPQTPQALSPIEPIPATQTLSGRKVGGFQNQTEAPVTSATSSTRPAAEDPDLLEGLAQAQLGQPFRKLPPHLQDAIRTLAAKVVAKAPTPAPAGPVESPRSAASAVQTLPESSPAAPAAASSLPAPAPAPETSPSPAAEPAAVGERPQTQVTASAEGAPSPSRTGRAPVTAEALAQRQQMYPDGGPTHIPSPAELGFPVYTNLRPEDSSTLLHIRAENEKAFNAADFAFRSGITDPQALADMTEDQKRLFMNGTKNPETGAWEGGALQHGRARGNPTPKTKYQVNRATGSMLDGHTLRLAQAHLAKMIADAGGGDMAPSGAQLEGAQALLQAKAQANPSLLDRIDAAGEESTQWLRDNGIFDGSGLGANRMLDPEAVYHLARSVAGDVARGVKTIKQAASDLMDKVRSIYPDANVTQAGMSGAIHKALNDYTGLNEIARKKQLQQLPPEALAQMRYEPGPKGLPGTITGNVEASALISRLSKLDDIVGLSFTRQHLQQYLRQAQWELYHKAVSSHDEEGNQYAVQLAPRQLDQLRQAIVVFKQALASKDDSFTYAEEDTPEDFEKTQREEWFHAQQRKHLGLGSGPDHIDNDAFFAHPLAQTAATSLVENYDYPIHPDILSAEIGAKIAAGSWDELGLEESEARDLFYEYGRLVVDRHGPGAVFKFREISPILREAFYDAGRTQGQIRGSTGALDFGRTVDPTSSVPRRAGESANPLDRGGPEGQGRVRPGVERSFSREVPVSRQGQVSATATGRDGRSSTLQAVAKRKSGAQIEAERIMAQLRARKGRQ